VEYNLIKNQLMKKENKIKIFLVDDDAVFLKLLEIEFLQNADFDKLPFKWGALH
jgi:two-component system, OmpR family, response regulator